MANVALTRIKKDLSDITWNPPALVSAGPTGSNYYIWQATIAGPPGTPYETGNFYLHVEFPGNYPFKPPQVRFKTKIMHPNINAEGTICLDVLGAQWTPGLSVAKLLESIILLLSEPNPDDPLNSHAAELYKHDRSTFDKQAREQTEKFAH